MYEHQNSKGEIYYLNTLNVFLKQGIQKKIYFFSRDQRSTACDKPEGWEVVEAPKTKLPMLKRIK